jgi:hypothetical protein
VPNLTGTLVDDETPTMRYGSNMPQRRAVLVRVWRLVWPTVKPRPLDDPSKAVGPGSRNNEWCTARLRRGMGSNEAGRRRVGNVDGPCRSHHRPQFSQIAAQTAVEPLCKTDFALHTLRIAQRHSGPWSEVKVRMQCDVADELDEGSLERCRIVHRAGRSLSRGRNSRDLLR